MGSLGNKRSHVAALRGHHQLCLELHYIVDNCATFVSFITSNLLPISFNHIHLHVSWPSSP